MGTDGHGLEERPQTRHVRFKKILLIDRDDEWEFPIREMLTASRYLSRMTSDIGMAVCSIGRNEVDLVVISSLVGDQALRMVLRELQALPTPPPVIVLAYLHGEGRWATWRSLPCLSILRTPFTPDEVLQAVRALIGEPWVAGTDGGQALPS